MHPALDGELVSRHVGEEFRCKRERFMEVSLITCCITTSTDLRASRACWGHRHGGVPGGGGLRVRYDQDGVHQILQVSYRIDCLHGNEWTTQTTNSLLVYN